MGPHLLYGIVLVKLHNICHSISYISLHFQSYNYNTPPPPPRLFASHLLSQLEDTERTLPGALLTHSAALHITAALAAGELLTGNLWKVVTFQSVPKKIVMKGHLKRSRMAQISAS